MLSRVWTARPAQENEDFSLPEASVPLRRGEGDGSPGPLSDEQAGSAQRGSGNVPSWILCVPRERWQTCSSSGAGWEQGWAGSGQGQQVRGQIWDTPMGVPVGLGHAAGVAVPWEGTASPRCPARGGGRGREQLRSGKGTPAPGELLLVLRGATLCHESAEQEELLGTGNSGEQQGITRNNRE